MNNSKDGFGAQTLRMLQVVAIARHLNMGFSFNPISGFEGNFGDGFVSQAERDKYLKTTRYSLVFDDITCRHWKHKLSLSFPMAFERFLLTNKFFRCFFQFFKSLGNAIGIELIVKNPEALIVKNASIYYQLDDLEVFRKKEREEGHSVELRKKLIRICLHIRRGVGILPGDRFQPTQWYIQNLQKIVEELSAHGFESQVYLHTDSPISDNFYSISNFSAESVEFMLENGQISLDEYHSTSIRVYSENLENQFAHFPNLIIKRDLRPLEAWVDFIEADIILLGKSTFSFVPTLLNSRALVIKPKGLLAGKSSWFELEEFETIETDQLRTFINDKIS